MIIRILRYLEKNTYLLYIGLILLTLVTLALTLLPQDSISDASIFQYDKIGHFLVFGTWTFLLGLTLLSSGKKPLPLLSLFIAGSLFGITVEILQEILPGDREMSLYDAVADIAGCLIAVWGLKKIASRLSHQK